MNTEKLRLLAPDLNRVAPRSPYAALDPFPVWAARLVDKCRAELLGQAGSYRFNCPMDREFLRAAGLAAPLGSHSSPPEFSIVTIQLPPRFSSRTSREDLAYTSRSRGQTPNPQRTKRICMSEEDQRLLELKEVGRAIAVLAEDKRILPKASKPCPGTRDTSRTPFSMVMAWACARRALCRWRRHRSKRRRLSPCFCNLTAKRRFNESSIVIILNRLGDLQSD